ncbi:hypothetical protein GF327_07195 [Candidatus Woesearchaeota archaeon]|nr:hypothetical protein [Candidatus Woesearchaeota archaeon]
MKIKDLNVNQNKINLTAELKEFNDIREFEKFGKKGRVRNATIEDESGKIMLVLWNEQIDKINKPGIIEIKNGYVKEWQGEKQLSVGKYGEINYVE